MRADRLVATLMLLQTRGRVTAAEVAAELEVSLKTARRDLEALSLAGVPVYSQTGRGGGWQLLGGARTDLSGLTAEEARTLFLVAGPAAEATPEVKATLRKLMRALPETFRAAAEAAARAVVLDAVGWGQEPGPATVHLATLQRAVIEQVQLQLAYVDHAGVTSERLVHPLGLVAKRGIWYLVADTAAGRRTFRVDRILAVALTAMPAERPEAFDLGAAWQEIAASVEEHRTRAQAHILAQADSLPGLREQFGVALTVGGEQPAGMIEAQIAGYSHRVIAEQLAGWGNQIEVTGPAAVRQELARIGAELLAAYDDGERVQARPGNIAMSP